MNSRTKLVAGVVAGLIGGATLMGAAFAAPRLVSGAGFGGYRMMGSASSVNTGAPTVAEMQSFMQNYSTSSGGIDVNRMHADVASGKVTPPCLNGVDRTTGSASGTTSAPQQGRGFGMMGGSYQVPTNQ